MRRFLSVHLILSMTIVVGALAGACTQPQPKQSDQQLNLQANAFRPALPTDQAIALLDSGVDQALQGNYYGAIKAYDKALQLNPQNSDIYYNRGVAHYSVGHPKQALQDFDRVIQLDPSFAEAYGNRGSIRLEQGDRQGAQQDFDQAAKLFTQQGDRVSAQQMQDLSQQSQVK